MLCYFLIMLILHLFLSTSCLLVLFDLPFLIADDRTNMVGGLVRNVLSLYQRVRCLGPSRGRERRRGRMKGKCRGIGSARFWSSVSAPSSLFEDKEEVPAVHEDLPDMQEDVRDAHEVQEKQGEVLTSSGSLALWLHGPSTLLKS